MRKTRRLISISGDLARTTLLAVAAVAVATLIVWTWRPGAVDRLDDLLFGAYVESYTSEYGRAAALLKNGETEKAERALEALVARMGTVRKQDRLANAWPAAAEALIGIYNDRGDGKRALELSRRLVAFDPNNYRFHLTLAYRLLDRGDTAGAVAALERARRIAPQSLEAASALAETLYKGSRTDQARAVLEDYLAANRAGSLALHYIKAGPNPTPARASSLPSAALTGGERSFVFPVRQKGVAAVVLTFSSVMDVEMTVHGLTVVTPGGRRELNPALTEYRLADMERTGPAGFAVTGPRPQLYMALAPGLTDMEIKAFEVRASFRPTLSPALNRILKGA
ncbi:MAG: tetratricopeptide repeat protein [Thermodesulfobacteriota bacterium]